MTTDTPSEEVERNSSMPLMVLSASSILSVISVSTSCGAAPGSTVVTVTVGNSTRGKRSTSSRRYEKMPITTSVVINIVAKTGRRTHSSANFCITSPSLLLLVYLWLTTVPVCSLSRLLVAMISPDVTPSLISLKSPSLAPVLTMRSTALPCSITKTFAKPATVTTALLGTITAGALAAVISDDLANIPGRSVLLGLATCA